MLSLQMLPKGSPFQMMRMIVLTRTCTLRSSSVPATNPGTDSAESNEQCVEDATKTKRSLVAAAFQSLKEEKYMNSTKINDTNAKPENKKQVTEFHIDEAIMKANNVHGLLAVAETNVSLSRKHALKIVSILAEWSTLNKVNLSDFENDARFLKLCRILGRTIQKKDSPDENNSNRISGFRTDDLNTVLGVAGDDEAAKLIASISLSQMVKVMSNLSQRKRRSTPLLRSLAFNISSSTDQLDIKQCADVLFAMASLNFQDSVLSAKLCADIQLGLTKKIEKSAVIGSILTSLGILKYRDLDIMEAITQWMMQNHDICRPQDVTAYVLSSAVLNFKSTNLDEVQEKLLKSLVPEDFHRPVEWLNHIWALSIIGLVSNNQLEMVLNEGFVKLLDDQKMLTPTAKMRLLNLNSYAHLLAKDYSGKYLTEGSSVFSVPIGHVKSKQILVNGMLDALKSLIPKNEHLQSLKNSQMGFLIDALCHFDSKRNPVPLDENGPNTIRVALMVVDYHDVCHGTHRCGSGVTNLYFDLLEKSGYNIIPIPYNEFNTSDKLLKRVQYLDKKFKALIKNKQV